MPDAHTNFAYSTVATAPSPPSSGTSLVVAPGTGSLFPAAPFNATIWPAGAAASASNAEIVRVTNVSTDTLTVTRTQESTSARTVVVGDQIAATITAKTLQDVDVVPSWTGLVYANSWSDFAGGYSVGAWWLDAFGVVHLRGLIKRTGTPGSGETMATLPSGARPPGTEVFNVLDANGVVEVDVTSAGLVQYIGAAATVNWLSLSGITFRIT